MGRKDEEFVKAVFSREEGGAKVKRIRDDSSSDDEVSSKFPRQTVTNPTDFLVDKKPEVYKKAVWEKRIGTMSSKKGGLGILVRKKAAVESRTSPSTASSTPNSAAST